MYFDHAQDWWKEKGAYWTAREIAQQPATWRKTVKQMARLQPEVQSFIETVTANPDYSIVCTGAGTSEFVGNSIYPFLNEKTHGKAHSYASTDITAAPQYYFFEGQPTLLISYRRSGNSPESIGAIDTANAYKDGIRHLLVTCNPDGTLAKLPAERGEDYFGIDLTPETHDQSFAMTSSYSNMFLATLLTFAPELAASVEKAADKTETFMKGAYAFIPELVDGFDFDRIVYLGSNNLKGVAQESALKMCELTAGKVDTVFDTPLGFRHGPKSVINDNTLTVLYLSDEPYTRQYEMDLLKEIQSQKKGNRTLVVSGQDDAQARELADYFLTFDNEQKEPNVVLALEYIPVAQLLGLYKSMAMGIGPDNPCPTGEVNRVVKGVTLYPYKKGE